MNRFATWLTIVLLLYGTPAWSEDDESAPEEARAEAADERWTAEFSDNWRLQFGSGELLYPVYVADPLRPTSSIARMSISDSEIPDAGGSRVNIRMGSHFGFLRLFDEAHPDLGLELDAQIGFLGQFNIDSSLDNIGWDGLYGFHINWRPTDTWALRLGIDHQSSHLGDEYLEDTGRQRLDYTRQEVVLGVSFDLSGSWRIYFEGGHAYSISNSLQADLRVQGGLEFEKRDAWFGRRATPYIALDLSSYEENDWEINHNLQAGLAFFMPGIISVYRFGVEWYQGRSTMGEFFLEDEEYVALGLWVDL